MSLEQDAATARAVAAPDATRAPLARHRGGTVAARVPRDGCHAAGTGGSGGPAR
jgi:hypothetical protein